MRLEEITGLLKATPLFQRLDADPLRLLAFSAITRTLRPGDMLFRRGDVADGGYLVVTGLIVLDPSDSGAPSNHIIGAGALIGQNALFAPIERPATAIAREPTTVLMLSRDLMLKVLDAHPDAAKLLRTTLTEQARTFSSAVQRAVG